MFRKAQETSERFAKIAREGDVQKRLSAAKNSDELLKVVRAAAGADADADDVSTTMRSIARAELEKHGFPEWAINSMFLGESVCW